MKSVVGLFPSRAAAEAAAQALRDAGFSSDRIAVLTPGGPLPAAVVPTTDAEQPGLGAAVGGVVGGATGASGAVAAAAMTSVFPGVGPVIAIGLLAGALAAMAGAAVGHKLEDALDIGVPKDELFLYQDALRRGRTVLVALADDDDRAEAARRVLRDAGAESLDAARERWWLGLRPVEAERSAAEGFDFTRDEPLFRRGFEAALERDTQGREYAEVVEYLRARDPDVYREPAFQRGYARGRAYHLSVRAAA
jgi:hypothetical protein